MRTRSSYIRNITKHDILSIEEERSLIKKAQRGDLEARNFLILSNMRLVVGCISKSRDYSRQFEVLIYAGVKGLIRAIEKFDLTLEIKLITYATWWIRQAIAKDILDTNSTIRIPVHIQKELQQYKKLVQKVEQEDSALSLDGIAKSLDLPVLKVRLLQDLDSTHVVSLNSKFHESELYELQDLIIDEDQKSIEAQLQEEQRTALLQKALCCLSQREREIIQKRYGISCSVHTLQELSMEHHLTRERIRQIQIEAIKKLKKNLKKTIEFKPGFDFNDFIEE